MRPYSDNEDIEGGSTSSATTTSPHKRAATANIASSRQHHLSVHTNNIQRPHSPIGSESPSELHGLNNGGGGSYVMTPGGSRHIQVGKSSKYTSEDEWDEEDDSKDRRSKYRRAHPPGSFHVPFLGSSGIKATSRKRSRTPSRVERVSGGMSGYFAVPMAHLQKLGLTSTEDNNDSIYNAVRNNNHSTRRSTSSCILMLAIALAILLGFSWGYFQAASGTLLTLLSPPLLSNRIYGNQSLFDETGAALYDYKNSPIYQEEKQNMRKVGDQKSLESGSPADLERAKKEASKISGTMVVDTSKIQHSSSGKARWETYAIALKSGKGIALGRIPVQLLTFLKDVENILVLGESPGISVGTHEMLDVCTHLYDKYKDKPANWNLTATSKVDTAKQQSDKIVPDIQSLGWKLDAHKNLPGFKALYDRFPQADWFIMMDDDSYIFMENIETLVSKLDPSKPIYMGSENNFVGCDGVKNYGDGPSFAHGGSGILVSRGALKKLVFDVDNCIIKYRDCWAGDVRTMLCLRDNGIKLNATKYFWGEPPNDEYSFPPDPCENPISFHHLLPSQIQKLYKASQRGVEELLRLFKLNEGDSESDLLQADKERLIPALSKTTYSDVFAEWGDELNVVEDEENIERPGMDFIVANDVGDYKLCRDYCRNEQPKCITWSWDTRTKKCLMKNGIPGRKQLNSTSGVRSGVFGYKYVCKRQLTNK